MCGVGVRWRGRLVQWWDFGELGRLVHLAVVHLLFGSEDLEDVEATIFARILFRGLSDLSNLQNVGLGDFFDMGGWRGTLLRQGRWRWRHIGNARWWGSGCGL